MWKRGGNSTVWCSFLNYYTKLDRKKDKGIYIYIRNGKDNFILPFLEKKPHSHLGKYCRRRVINCVRASIIDALSVAVVLLQRSFGG